jgi:predicted GTPase
MEQAFGCLKAYFDDVARAGTLLDGVRASVDNRVDKVRGAIDTFRRAVPASVGKAEAPPEVRARLADLASEIESGLERWGECLQDHLHGARFLDLFDDSVVVFVSGKVNCGKSRLGNLLSGHSLRSLVQPLPAAAPPHFFRVEEGPDGQVLQRPFSPDMGFKVGPTETTKCIQGFRLGGLSWLDVPGVHSTTVDYQALARRYARHSELLVYLTDSDSPGRISDVLELAKYVEQQHPVLLVVTKADRAERLYDEDDNEIGKRWEPQPEENRQQQENWLRQCLEKIQAGDRFRVLEGGPHFISVEVAEQSLRDSDGERFRRSGIPELLRQIGGILQNGPALKSGAPRRNFNTFLTEMLKGRGNFQVSSGRQAPGTRGRGVAQVLEECEKELEMIERLRDGIVRRSEEIAERVRLAAWPSLLGMLGEERQRVERGEEPSADLEVRFHGAVVQALTTVVEKEVASTLSAKVRGNGLAGLLRSLPLEGIKVKRKSRKVKTDNVKARVRGGAIAGLLTIGALAFFVPTWWVAALVSVGASAAGAYAGEKFADPAEVEVPDGTNAWEVFEALEARLRQELPERVGQALKGATNLCLQPHQDYLVQVQTALLQLRSDLEQLYFPAEETRS